MVRQCEVIDLDLVRSIRRGAPVGARAPLLDNRLIVVGVAVYSCAFWSLVAWALASAFQ